MSGHGKQGFEYTITMPAQVIGQDEPRKYTGSPRHAGVLPKVCGCENRPGVFWAGYWSEDKWAISDQGEYHPGCVDGETYITYCPYCGHKLPETRP